jgi:4-azaleucine resistance transporter AzlC
LIEIIRTVEETRTIGGRHAPITSPSMRRALSRLAPEQRRVLAESMGVAAATAAYGVSFGAIGATSGFTVWQTCVLSLLVFTGASQYAMIGIVASGGSMWSGSATALMLGTRNTLYGLRLARLLRLRGWRRLAGAQIVIDESTAMALKPKGEADARLAFFATGIGIYVLWNLATLIGAVAGDAIGDTDAYGLDAAVPAAFLALLWPRLDSAFTRLTALTAAALALVLVPLTRPGFPVIAAAAVAVGAALVRRPAPPSGGDG